MPNDMTIPAVQAIAASPQPRPARTTTAEPRAAEPRPYVNPTLRLDRDVGLVVMEFRDDDGKVTTIPNERQLAAYRAHQEAAADLASARNAIETSAAFPEIEGFAEPRLGFGEANTSPAATETPATGANPSTLSPDSARPATPSPIGLMPPGAIPSGAIPSGAMPTGSTPTGSTPTGPALASSDGSAPVAGPARG